MSRKTEKSVEKAGPDRPANGTAPSTQPSWVILVEPDTPPTRAEVDLLAAQVRRLAAQVAHGRA